MTKKLIAIDLDGTLLPHNKKIPFFTRLYLKRLSKQGHIVVLASGRPTNALLFYRDQIGSKAPIVAFNGTSSTNPDDQSFPQFKRALDKNDIIEIYKNATKEGVLLNTLLETDNETWLDKRDSYLEEFFWLIPENIKHGSISKTLDKHPLTCVFKVVRNERNDKKLIEIVSKSRTMKIRFWGSKEYAEVYEDNSSKAEPLLKICEYYGIPRKDFIAFGDSYNDIEMLQAAGIAVAMSNGKEAIKNVSSHISVHDHMHQGVKKTLKKLLK